MSFANQAQGGAHEPAATGKAGAAPGKQTQVEAAEPDAKAASAPSPSGINLATLQSFISKHEGYVDHVYLDSRGFPTAGIGHLLTGSHPPVGTKVSAAQITEWFKQDVAKAITGAKQDLGPAFDRLDEARKIVVIDMVFNLGSGGFGGFHATIHAIQTGAFAQAATDMLQSLWASQVGGRAKEDAAIMRSGSMSGTGGSEGAGGGGASHGGGGGGTAKPSPTIAQVRAGHGVLEVGEHGPAVTELQHLLRISADGDFGPQTKAAVETVQRAHHLAVDGIVGKLTLEALDHKAPAKPPSSHQTGGGTGGESHDGAAERSKMLGIARSASAGKRPDGYCYKHVCEFLVACGGYGKITNPYNQFPSGDLPYAHDFADLMNSSGGKKFGLDRLSISNPYDAPSGAIVVVAAGSPGTANPIAGDISVADGNGGFYNGGQMSYGGRAGWTESRTAKLLGCYVPA